MAVIDWLETFEFIRANSERFILYCLCGCFIGITLILIGIVILFYIEKRNDVDDEESVEDEQSEMKNSYQVPRLDLNYDLLNSTRSYLPVYRYDGRTNGFYDV